MPEFGELVDVDVRQAWPHEARDFTPWLSGNLTRLSTVIGIPLELIETEVAVESFSADILARNPQDGSSVLIENQFTESNHGHLGQIMTYLAGLEAKTIIWIAPSFREAHLSAVRWLNEHTTEEFAFFAVQIRVVRIGASPMAPLFDVIERPNDWERQLQSKAQAAHAASEIGDFRREFWNYFLTRHPKRGDPTKPYGHPSRWLELPELPLLISYYLAQNEVGVFVRSTWKGDSAQTRELIGSYRGQLEAELGTNEGRGGYYFFISKLVRDMKNRENWAEASDWLDAHVTRYERVLRNIMGSGA